MKKAAAILALVMAVILGGNALSSWKGEADHAGSRIDRDFHLAMTDEAAYRDQARSDHEDDLEHNVEAVAAVAFLIAAFVLFRSESKPDAGDGDASLSLLQ